MHPIVMSPVASSTLQKFSTLSHKSYGFRKLKLLNIKFVCLIFSTGFD